MKPMSNYVLQICFGTYLLLSVPAALLLWIVLIISRIDDTERGPDRQRFYRIALAIWNLRNARYGRAYDLQENLPSYNTASSAEPLAAIEEERQSSPLFYLQEEDESVKRTMTAIPKQVK
jgi:hypothetical protein